MRTRLQTMIKSGATKDQVVQTIEKDYGWRATGCPPPPQMTGGCLQYQQIDALIAELR
jgi:cytochrome c-type biogenesis protein CcmH/NrfF